MKFHNSRLALRGKKKLAIPFVIHEEVFSKHCRASGFTENVEIAFPIPVPIAPIATDLPLFTEHFICHIPEYLRQIIGFCLSGIGMYFPACTFASAGSVHMDRYKDRLALPIFCSRFIGSSCSLCQRYIHAFLNQQLTIYALCDKLVIYRIGYLSGILPFKQL